MRIAILANNENSFVPSLAESFKRMLDEIGVESKIFHEGLVDVRDYQLSRNNFYDLFAKYFVKQYRDFRFFQLVSQLNKFDAVVVIGHIPDAFLRGFVRDISIRQALPEAPIILYSNYYLPTRGLWMKYLKEGSVKHGINEGGHYGLERYDYYLCTSVVSEYSLANESQPYSLIGINVNDGTLFPEQKSEFIALLDFQRSDHLEEREVQLQALKETNVKYIELRGSYSRKEIREIYRRCSIYFIAHRESFGLPICELQACGSYIFTPYSNWCPSHWIKEDLSKPGEGALSPNFIVYDNNKERLVQEINRVKANFSSSEVLKNFHIYHSHLIHGDVEELRKFVDLLQSKKIHSKSHKSYSSFNLY